MFTPGMQITSSRQKVQQTQEEVLFFHLLLYLPKGTQIEKPASGRKPEHMLCGGCELGVADGEDQAATLLSVAHVFRAAKHEVVCHMFAFPQLPRIACFLFEVPDLCLPLLSPERHLSLNAQHVLQSHSPGEPYMHICSKLVIFSERSISCELIVSPARRT